jgi:release factor glutamine methyltransferase
MTLQSLRQKYFKVLSSHYPEHEIGSIFDICIEWLLNLSKIEIHRNLGKSISLRDEKKALEALNRLSANEPVQYIVGYTEFCDLMIKVDSRVLIPRPETEYLVTLVLKEIAAGAHDTVMDLCTGSGCIALALARNLPGAMVYAVDNSLPALSLAKENAIQNKVGVSFMHDDILDPRNPYPVFNLIVSNPPYVRESEKKAMHRNVLDFEPEPALFVPDSDPLKFYRAIINFADKHLAKKGSIYTEINEALGKECLTLFQKSNYRSLNILKDLDNKDRYLKAEK